MVTILNCKCGDCAHWEIFKEPVVKAPDSEIVGRIFDAMAEACGDAVNAVLGTDDDTFMVCKTCGDKHHIKISFPDHEKLSWVEAPVA